MIEPLMKKHLKGFKAKNILDVGPGYSNFARNVAKITGATEIEYFDCDSKVLDWQIQESKKDDIEANGLSINLNSNNLNKLKKSYDIILCMELLEHLSNVRETIISLRKLLSQNGRIIVTVPTKKSERWLKKINPSYMKNEPYGHVREFDEQGIKNLLNKAGFEIVVFIPTQPHYFIMHTWIFGSRMRVENSTGKIITKGMRARIGDLIFRASRKIFLLTDAEKWGRIFPRNYFIIAKKS
jgi:cyclopropane fatty-acyl-phospholipid synthase-like methyltransferase